MAKLSLFLSYKITRV